MDALDDRLDAARLHVAEDPALESAASELVRARLRDSRSTRRRIIVPVLAISLATVFAGGAAFAAAMNWGPWIVSDPDVVVSRTWYDGDGKRLGYCESRLTAADLPTPGSRAFREELAKVDIAAMEPDAATVAALLRSEDRLDDLERLLPEALFADPPSPFLDKAGRSDARILQDGLVSAVLKEAITRAFETTTDPNSFMLLSPAVTQCAEDLP